ncbi:MAG: DUF4239 domain-containing protein [Methyloceanibacter sp.]|jgi:hypothetical protein
MRDGRAFKALSPGMLPPLGIIFGLLVGFVAVQVWNYFDRAKLAVAAEASALRGIVILAESVPAELRGSLRRLVNRHIEQAVTHEWGFMAQRRLTMETMPTHLIEALRVALALQPADETQKMVQREIINDVHRALEARHQRIVVSQTSVSVVKWAAILLQGLCTLVAIAMVHSDNRLTCAIALAIFATGIAVSVLLIAAYSRPFTGEISVGPQLLQQVIATESPDGVP